MCFLINMDQPSRASRIFSFAGGEGIGRTETPAHRPGEPLDRVPDGPTFHWNVEPSPPDLFSQAKDFVLGGERVEALPQHPTTFEKVDETFLFALWKQRKRLQD
ncbi:MAG: hypothetical protein HFJ84_04870 [Clostridiales bacterium]|nr:hypothetical protein [Clostridiales bacterium]